MPDYRKLKKPRGPQRLDAEPRVTVAAYLGMPDEEGQTELERQVWRVAGELNIRFDEAQKYLPVSGGYEATLADFWCASPPQAIFVDGIQHELRDDVKRADFIQRNQLRGMGIIVTALNWRGLIENPRQEVAKILTER